MINQLFSKKNIVSWVIKYLFMQSFLTLISLPILVEWGLAFSLTSFLGNCFFAPFISIYLALSFFIFFTELCALPNFFFIAALEKVTFLWVWLTELLGSGGLWYMARPQPIYFFILVVFSFALIATSYSLVKKTILLLSLLVFTLFGLSVFAPSKYGIEIVVGNKKPLIVLCLKGMIIGIDYGALSKSASRQNNFVRYTLKPVLIRRYGKDRLDMLIFPVYDKRNAGKAAHIQESGFVKNIHYV